MLIGHGVYRDVVGYWPTATSQLADRMTATQTLVISTTPDQLEWHNARHLLVDDDLPGVIGDLKAAPGRDIVLYGGVRLAQSMTRHDLIDEYRLAVTPVALGKGLPLFPPDTLRQKLWFCGVQPFESGTLLASYVPHR
jgi:dihydrofolate reductase